MSGRCYVRVGVEAYSIYNMLLHSLSSTASSSVSPFSIDSIHPAKKESRPDLFRSIVCGVAWNIEHFFWCSGQCSR